MTTVLDYALSVANAYGLPLVYDEAVSPGLTMVVHYGVFACEREAGVYVHPGAKDYPLAKNAGHQLGKTA